MSNTTGYIAMGLIGGALISLIAGGMYYASGDNKLTPTGMTAYQQVTPHFGGTRKRRKHRRKH